MGHTCMNHNGDPAYCDACREENEERRTHLVVFCDTCGADITDKGGCNDCNPPPVEERR